jgi:hypothetical protein
LIASTPEAPDWPPGPANTAPAVNARAKATHTNFFRKFIFIPPVLGGGIAAGFIEH